MARLRAWPSEPDFLGWIPPLQGQVGFSFLILKLGVGYVR